MKTYSYGIGFVALAVAVGCGKKEGPEEKPTPPGVVQRVALKGFTGANACGDLEQYIEDTAVQQMKAQLEQTKQSWGRAYVGVPESAPTAAGAADSSNAAAPSAYTKTNTQVAGVDEADFVKTNGTHIFALSGRKLYITQSWPAESLQRVSTLELEGYPTELFLDDAQRLVVFSRVSSIPGVPAQEGSSSPGVGMDAMICPAFGDCGGYGSSALKVTVVDVSDVTAPKVTRSVYLSGSYSDSRRVGSAVRVVLSSGFNYPTEVRWWPEQLRYDADEKTRNAEIDKLIAHNEALIRGRTLQAWLPAAARVDSGQTPAVYPIDCTEYFQTTASTQLGFFTVATLNLDTASLQRTNVVSQVGEVYASTESLYVFTQHWWWWPMPGQQDAAYVHKFDIAQPNAAVYVASGTVEGHIVDQFSMDEHKGYFRIATTIATRVEDPQNAWGRIETTNRVSVLQEKNGALEVVGKSEDLAPGERIYSARFMGDRGYVVTFRQVDPLYTFDLSNPTQPKKVGELKIPGFSSYLHPIDDNHLLAIGSYMSETGTGPRTVQLTIFDVSDMSQPKQKFNQLIGSVYGASEAQYDHKAFNYFPEKKLLAIPFTDWQPYSSDYWGSFKSELKVFHIDTATGITSKGALSMKDVYQSFGSSSWSYYWSPTIRRSVMADDFVYAISDAGIRVANNANLSTPLATVKFDPVTY